MKNLEILGGISAAAAIAAIIFPFRGFRDHLRDHLLDHASHLWTLLGGENWCPRWALLARCRPENPLPPPFLLWPLSLRP